MHGMLNYSSFTGCAGGYVRGGTKLVVACAVALLMPVMGDAQQDQTLRDRDPYLDDARRLTEELQDANFRWRRFYLLSRFRLAEVSFAGPVDIPAGGESQRLSFGVETLQRLYFVPHRKVILSAEAVPSYAFFEARNAEGDTTNGQFNYNVRGDAHFLLNHLYLDVYGQRSDQLRAYVSDINRLATARQEEFGVRGELKYSSRTSAMFSARTAETTHPRSRFQPSRPAPGDDVVPIPVQQLDRDEVGGRVSLLHRTLPRTSFFAAGEASSYSFHQSESRDANRFWAGAGMLFDSGRTQIRVEAGPARLDFEDAAVDDFAGVIGTFSATRQHRRWSTRASWNRDVGFALATENPYFLSDVAGVSGDFQATRRLTLRVATAWQTDRYDQPVSGIERRDDISFSTIGFRHSTRILQTGLDVGWYERRSTAGIEEDSGIRYVVHLSLTP